MKIEEMMDTEPATIELPADRMEVLQLMSVKDMGAIYVVGKEMELKGIVTRRDLLRYFEKDQVALIMKRDPVFAEADDDLSTAARLIYESRIHNLPVKNSAKEGKLVGACRTRDFLKAIDEGDHHDTIESVMGLFCAPVYHGTPLSVIRDIMEVSNGSALCVLDDNGKVVGMISEADLFRYCKVDETISRIEMGLGEDEDKWTWEGMRDIVGLYYINSKLILPDIPVKEAMIKNVISVSLKSRVSLAARKMRINGLEQLPIMDANGKLKGMICDIDLLKVLMD